MFTFNKTQIQKIEELASNMPIDKVAEQFGMEEETFCDGLRRQKAALQAYKKGRTIGAIRAAEKLQGRMAAGDIGAVIFFSKLYGLGSNEQKYEATDKTRPSLAFKIVINKNA